MTVVRGQFGGKPPLKAVGRPNPDRSLTFALMAVAHHREEGEITAAKHALGDALWLMHKGTHESLTDQEMLVAIRKLLGFSWSPQPNGEAA